MNNLRSSKGSAPLRADRRVITARRAAALFLSAAAAAVSPTTRAADWTGATNSDWLTPGNWTPAAVPTAADLATFPATYTTAPTLDAPAGVRGLVVNNAGSPYTFSGSGTLSLGTAGLVLTGGGAVTFSPTLNVAAPQTWDIAASTSFTTAGPLAGLATLTKTGAGTLELNNAANPFLGGYIVTGGTLQLGTGGNVAALGLRSNRVDLAAGATLTFSTGSPGSGELSGAGAVSGPTRNLFMTALNDATFSGAVTLGSTSAGLNVRGVATQSFTGDLAALDGRVVLFDNATLRLAGSAAFQPTSLSSTTAAGVTFRGGTLVLDNAATNNPNRLKDNPVVEFIGGGDFNFIGNAAGTTETIGQLQSLSGAMNVNIAHNAGANAATVLNLTGVTRNGRATINFTATGGTIGASLNGPRVMFNTPLPYLVGSDSYQVNNGTLSILRAGATNVVGFATINYTDFVTYDDTLGIKAVTTTPFPAASNPTANALITSNSTTGASADEFNVQTLKIAPTAPGQSLDINGIGNFNTSALILAGPHDFTISGTAGGRWVGGTTRYTYVADPNATLHVTANLTSTGQAPISKSGPGALAIEGANDFTSGPGAGAVNINVLDGVIRFNNQTLAPGNTVLAFRGGVFEYVGGGTISRPLGTQTAPTLATTGSITWSGGATDQGSGGFSAVGGNLTIDLIGPNGAGNVDVFRWQQTNFVQAGLALVFGSTRADSQVDFTDSISLRGSDTTDSFYSAREIRVIDNPNSTTDRALLSGSVTSLGPDNGGRNADLLKTGNGLLVFGATNHTYLGNTIVAGGTLQLDGTTLSPNYLLKAGTFTVSAGAAIPETANLLLQGGSANVGASTGRVAIDSVVGTAGTLTVGASAAPNSKVLVANSIAVSGTAAIDLKNNGMVLDYDPATASPIASVRAALLAGNLTSSVAAASAGSTAIGYAEASTFAASNRAALLAAGPLDVDDSAIILKYTKSGDATLDGAVDFNDLVKLAQNYNTVDGARDWSSGDFTYDGNVDFNDLVKLAQNYNTSLPTEPVPGASASFSADLAAAFAAVPEPGTFTLLSLAACGLAAQRRRRPSTH